MKTKKSKKILCLVCREYKPVKGFYEHAVKHALADIAKYRSRPIGVKAL